ncbi:MAG: YlxR family protein [Prochloron sp. SP5CPC1]|nr:YlxR family protein [Candidatus Paraprochloron terpiosi SP5CPC1]
MKTNYRRCISCRKVGAKESFWRIVRVYLSREVQLEKGMGRSAYICRSAECLRVARQKNKLGRSLKATVPEHIYQSLSLADVLTILPRARRDPRSGS